VPLGGEPSNPFRTVCATVVVGEAATVVQTRRYAVRRAANGTAQALFGGSRPA
jgi:hypothetical protein